MAWKPDLIFQQGTSSDPGPGYLGTGTSYADRAGIKHDLKRMICSAHKLRFLHRLLGGGEAMRRWNGTWDHRRDRPGKSSPVQCRVISSEVDKEFIKEKLRRGARAKAVDPISSFPST